MERVGERLRVARGDLWEAEGALREAAGGGTLELPGARLASSGLERPEWNCAHVIDPQRLDVDDARAWYARRAHGAGVPWQAVVRRGAVWALGSSLRTVRLMGLERSWFRPVAPADRLTVHRAGSDDLDAVSRLVAPVYGVPLDDARAWTAPHLGVDHVAVVLCAREDVPVGVATGVLTDGRAGPCLGIVEAGELEPAIRLVLVSWLVEAALHAGAELVGSSPTGAADSRDYAQLGFLEGPALDAYRMA